MIRVCLWLECINIHPLGRFKYCRLWNYCQTRRTHGFGIKMALERFSLQYRLFSIIYNHINVLMVAPKSERLLRELSLWWSPSTALWNHLFFISDSAISQPHTLNIMAALQIFACPRGAQRRCDCFQSVPLWKRLRLWGQKTTQCCTT